MFSYAKAHCTISITTRPTLMTIHSNPLMHTHHHPYTQQRQHKPTLNIPLEFGFRSAPMPTSPSLPLAATPPSPPVEGLRCRRFPLASSCPSFRLSACTPAPLAAPSPARTPAYPPPRPPSRREGSFPPSRPASRSLSLSLRRSRSSTLMEGTPAKDCAEVLDVRPSDADSKAFSLRWSRARCPPKSTAPS